MTLHSRQVQSMKCSKRFLVCETLSNCEKIDFL